MKAQDEEELFDLLTPDGEPLGIRKARAAVHRDGDWHRSVHIWVWGVLDGAPHLVLQRRSRDKDTWPRALDVAVTGHARAGESIEETLREAEEEIGLPIRMPEVTRLGRRRRASVRVGVADNELQEIFARTEPVDIAALVPSPAELEAIVALPFARAERVMSAGEEVVGRRLCREEGRVWLVEETVSGAEVVPARDGYYTKACESLAVVLAGEVPRAWEIG